MGTFEDPCELPLTFKLIYMSYSKGDVVHINHPKQKKFKGLYVVYGWDKLSLFLNKLNNEGVADKKITVTALASPYITLTSLQYRYL